MLPGVDSAVARSVNPMWLLKCCVIVDLPTIQTGSSSTGQNKMICAQIWQVDGLECIMQFLSPEVELLKWSMWASSVFGLALLSLLKFLFCLLVFPNSVSRPGQLLPCLCTDVHLSFASYKCVVHLVMCSVWIWTFVSVYSFYSSFLKCLLV